VCMAMQEFGEGSDRPAGGGIAVVECRLKGQGVDVLDAEFFDDELLVVAYRLREEGKAACWA
jgi:hypothetical protein